MDSKFKILLKRLTKEMKGEYNKNTNMQGIEFEDDRNLSGLVTKMVVKPASGQSSMIRILAKVGIEDKTTANYILLGVSVVFFGVTIFLYAGILK